MIFDYFDLGPMIEPRESPGEMHLHESRYSCSNVFSFPNSSGLKGIGPHIHDKCDDIELVIEGEVAIPRTKLTALKISAPFLIINPMNTVHSFVSMSEKVSVFGYRSPKSYQGQALLSKWLDDALEPHIFETSPIFVDLRTSEDKMYKTPNTIVRVHKIDGRQIVRSVDHDERVFFTFDNSVLEGAGLPESVDLPRHSLVVLSGRTDVTLSSAGRATIVEFIARSGGHSV